LSAIEDAADLFLQKFNCAQATLGALGPAEGLDRDTCLKIAATFGGGISRMGETCGAVVGSLMLLGLRYGGQTLTNPEAKAAVYEKSAEFMKQFRERNGSIVCRDLVGCDVSTPEGMAEFMARDFHNTFCVGLVKSACEILETM
jgi:C_GCAxxG_C_C family probable redox protein